MIEFLFLDLDNTILDFDRAESTALEKALATVGITADKEVAALYSRINKRHWQMLERREITRDALRVNRFRVLFQELGVEADPAAMAQEYEKQLSAGCFFLPGAEEAVARLSRKYRLYIASNGNAHVQHGRMTGANLYRFFEKVFISQEVGADKPSPEFFRRSFAQIPDFDPRRALLVGDSLSSDIQGGRNAGIATCWINPGHAPAKDNIVPDYQLDSLTQLEALLETLQGNQPEVQ